MLTQLAAILNAPVPWLGASRAEAAGALLGIVMVLFNMRVNPIAWPLAIASSLLYLLVFWDARLYGDAALQLVFAALAAWGWWQWLFGHQADGAALRVRRMSDKQRGAALLALALLWPATGFVLRHATDTDVPWWDAFPTAASLVAQVLLARKYIENWPAWFVINIVAVGLFAYKGLWLTVGLYVVFALLALAGWRTWARQARSATAAPRASAAS